MIKIIIRRIRLNLIYFKEIIEDKLLLLNFNYQSKLCEVDNNTIVFVSDKVLNRVEKLSYALRSNGKKVILLYKLDKNLNKNNYDELYKFRSCYGAEKIIKKLNPTVIHLFSSWDYQTSYYLVKKFRDKVKTVFDDYDIWAGIVNKKYISKHYLPGQIKKEKFCIENANGICCRSLELQVAKRKLNYKICKLIFFPEYTYNYEIKPMTGRKVQTIVYAGNLNKNIINIARHIEETNWRLEVYPAHFSIKEFPDCPVNLKVMNTVDSKELLNILSQYRYGLIIPPDLAEGENDIYNSHKTKYAMTGKLFDYAETGCRVIAKDYELILWLLKRMNCLVELKKVTVCRCLSRK